MSGPIPGYSQTPADRKYLLALGQFIDQFAKNEAMVHLLLQTLCKVRPKIAAAVFSGARIDGAMSFIKRIMEVENPGKAKREEIDDLLPRLREIAALRNDIVHYGSRVYGDQRIVTNEFLAHTDTRVRKIQVSPQMLRDATYDLNKINIHLVFNVLRGPRTPGTEPFLTILNSPWRYKPPKQAQRHRKNLDTSPEQ